MKLFLASWSPSANEVLGKAFLELPSKPANQNKLLILSMDTTSDFHRKYLEIEKQWYIKQGFQERNVSILNLKNDVIPGFEDLDVLHMWGGNTWHYLKRIRETGLVPRIREFIDRGGVYVGTSAGSLLMCPDVDERLTSDPNDVGLVDVSGFGYIDFNIVPHWDSKESLGESTSLMDCMRYVWETGKRVVPLTDNQAVRVLDGARALIRYTRGMPSFH
jgi:peptidase E